MQASLIFSQEKIEKKGKEMEKMRNDGTGNMDVAAKIHKFSCVEYWFCEMKVPLPLPQYEFCAMSTVLLPSAQYRLGMTDAIWLPTARRR